jgi:hypothetical protein
MLKRQKTCGEQQHDHSSAPREPPEGPPAGSSAKTSFTALPIHTQAAGECVRLVRRITGATSTGALPHRDVLGRGLF